MPDLVFDYIDLYLIHQPYNDYYGAWKALEELYRDGKIKAIGVDNFTQDKLADFIFFNSIKPAINMIECNPFFQRENERKYMEEQEIQCKLGPHYLLGREIFLITSYCAK